MSWDKDRIVELLLEAGDMAREARKKLTLEIKSDHSLVTQADTAIEVLFTEALEDEAAGRYIIGEETISRKGEDYVQAALAGEAWVVDPIDGTAPFAHFLPNWGVSVGYMKDGRLLHGGVYLPDYGELIISSGEDEFTVTEGKLEDGEWTWKELIFPPRPSGGRGLIAITQALAKRGQCLLPNPVMALGAAVVPLLGLLQGRFLAYLVRVTLKVSHNLHATMYPVLIGALKGKRGNRAAGYGAISDFFAAGGLDVNSVFLNSGSGGGRSDSLSARFLVDLLHFMAKRKDFAQFFDALPIGGIDGTISARFKNSPLWGRVRAKTGTLVYKGSFNNQWIYLSKALSGYMDLRTPDRPDDMLCFTILIGNTVTPDRSRGVKELFGAQEDILKAIERHWNKPARAKR